MGLCISSSAHKIQDGHEAPMSFERSEDSNGIQMHGSLYSLEGSKGVNQDSAILYQVCEYFFSLYSMEGSKGIVLCVSLAAHQNHIVCFFLCLYINI